MCLSPLTIKNRSKYFNLNTLHKAVIQVPCGHCAECCSAKMNEYYVRSYYQSQECLKHGGYILFQTMTYAPEYLPMLSDVLDLDMLPEDLKEDFPVFRYTDIRLFLVQLREELKRYLVKRIYDRLVKVFINQHGCKPDKNEKRQIRVSAKKEYVRQYGSKVPLKYFICAEYGELRHRPHYHGTFYVYDSSIDPVFLVKMMLKCWKRGRLDGASYDLNGKVDIDIPYLLTKRVFRGGCDDGHLRAVLNYVSKYMVKDSKFSEEIRRRLEYVQKYVNWRAVKEILDSDVYQKIDEYDMFAHAVFNEGFVQEYGEDFETRYKELVSKKLTPFWKKYLGDLRRHVSQFTKQSQGFGIHMIEALGQDWIYEHNCVRMPDSKTVWKELPIPGYIVGKLFKESKIDSLGNVYSTWSDYGNEFRWYHSEESLEKMADKFRVFFHPSNLSQYFSQDVVDKTLKKVANVRWRDFVYFMKYYDGRIYVGNNGVDLENVDVESYYYIDQHEVEDFYVTNDELYADYKNVIIHDKYYDQIKILYQRLNKKIAKMKQAKFEADMHSRALMEKYGGKFKK